MLIQIRIICMFYFQTQQSEAYTNFLQSVSSFVKDVTDVSISVFVKNQKM